MYNAFPCSNSKRGLVSFKLVSLSERAVSEKVLGLVGGLSFSLGKSSFIFRKLSTGIWNLFLFPMIIFRCLANHLLIIHIVYRMVRILSIVILLVISLGRNKSNATEYLGYILEQIETWNKLWLYKFSFWA